MLDSKYFTIGEDPRDVLKGMLLRAQGWVIEELRAAGLSFYREKFCLNSVYRDSYCDLEPEPIHLNSTQAGYSSFGISSL